MKISLNWLKDYIDLSGLSVDEISSKLTMSGLEVEDVYNEYEKYKDFVVGKVTHTEKHPNADKLSLCKVSTGNNEYQVVCGAPNVAEGQKVIFAPVGTLIPKGNFKITKAKIRGVESVGMLCAEDELELGNDHSGILVLDGNLKEGTKITDALNLNDVVFEVAITPNRPDALSHIGVARDLTAIFNKKLLIPEVKLNTIDEDINSAASIEVNDKLNCPRYTAIVVKDVTIKESPDWLKTRLTKIGLRPINNVVDITNYVMHEVGQPLHAFDLDTLAGKKIVVKHYDQETKFTTLDSKERKLEAGSLYICDGEKPVGIAGVMGGENSEITNKTKNILIESAYFNPSSIRKTAKDTGISTDASYRFERGSNPNITRWACERAAELIGSLGEGKILKGVIDVYPDKILPKQIEIRYSRVEKVLGYKISNEKIKTILKNLEFKIVSEDENSLTVEVPTFRPDVEREIDIIEEAARINGYDNIPEVSKITVTLSKKFDASEFADKTRMTSSALGLFEMINNPLQNDKTASLIGSKVPMLNPQSLDMAYLRTSLIPGALNTIAKNINVGEKNVYLFEIGNVFNKKIDGDIKSFNDFTETTKFLIIISGKESLKSWQNVEKDIDIFSLKSIVNSYLYDVGLGDEFADIYNIEENTIFDLYYNKKLKTEVIGEGGRVNKQTLKQFDIDQDVYCFEFNIDLLKMIEKKPKKYQEPLKYPKVLRDFAFVFDKSILYDNIVNFIKQEGSGLLKSVELFDIFESESLGKDTRSLAFSLEYYSEERTLKEDEVEKAFSSLIDKITKKFNAKLRG
ncbi:MAG TPA: phenylalanine--tRNA ligase subunit beta [Ignavibacteriaceae bacterium]|nr:phenylalanine--tRNA ligase subunit beta [Ignavibacteriaceae bacterium]